MLVYKKINEDRNERYNHGETGQRRLFENNENKMLYYTSIPMTGNSVRLTGAEYTNREADFTVSINALYRNFREIVTPEARNFIREYVAPENQAHIQDDWGYEKDYECSGDCENCEFENSEDRDKEKSDQYWFEDLIKDVFYNGSSTTVVWNDGCKTTVKPMEGDVFDPMAGFALAVVESLFYSKGRFREYVKKYYDMSLKRKPSKKVRKMLEKANKELENVI